MNREQYLAFMRKYASKDIIRNFIQRNADGTFAKKPGQAGLRTINLQKLLTNKGL